MTVNLRFFRVFLPILFLFPHLLYAAAPIQGPGFSGPAAAQARLRLLSTAESFLGTPYRFAGLDRRGLDCSGLVHLSFREGLNQRVPRTVGDLYNWVEKIPARDLQPGDLVFFVTVGSRVSHVGIYAGNGRFIHSASEGPRTGVINSDLSESYWSRTFLGAGRALPWNGEAALVMASAIPPAGTATAPAAPPGRGPGGSSGSSGSSGGRTASPASSGSSGRSSSLSGLGFFVGFGGAWTWGPIFDGMPAAFRGISTQATLGYKWSEYHIGLQLRPEWDNKADALRIPLTMAIGTDTFHLFAGPAFATRGEGRWQWDIGFYGAFPAIKISKGSLFVYGEFAWQPDNTFSVNTRVSTGLRYIFDL